MKVLLFCDPGIDDAFAIMYALLHEKIEVVGIVTSYGNVSKQKTIDNAHFLTHLAGKQSIPIIEGAVGPLSADFKVFYPEIHGEYGIGQVISPSYPGVEKGFGTLFDIIDKCGSDPDFVIVDVGRSTSLASAFILSEKTMEKVQHIVLMGGAFHVPGNVTSVAEANWHGDPIATNIVLQKSKKVTIFPLNVTVNAVWPKVFRKTLYAKSENSFRQLYRPMLEYYAKAYKELKPSLDGPPLHDLLVIYGIVHMNRLTTMQKKVSVETNGSFRGMSVADFRQIYRDEESHHHIVVSFPYDHYMQETMRVLISPQPT
ncbi:nucleoside hydrolase [Bacillus fonticola]|uniref:nucleoside hydrolase n=1 Tax=Bacillus fonticola TaxID=2728853 RepID=UPI001472FC6E|nr:nucleoside hydrolase [Bacillus fonticola]